MHIPRALQGEASGEQAESEDETLLKNITTFDFTELNKFDKVFCLVSGGFDSTYLYEMRKQHVQPEKLFPVNCWNPFEQSPTLSILKKEPRYIQVQPDKLVNHAAILKRAFLALPKAKALKRHGRYHKKVFVCCQYFKHKAFMKDPLFKEPNTVVISGIKGGDYSMQRQKWLGKMRHGGIQNQTQVEVGFYHRHETGQLYCYPLRDFMHPEFSKETIAELRVKYPDIKHSGCALCPILVLSNLKEEGKRYIDSVIYANKLLGQHKLF